MSEGFFLGRLLTPIPEPEAALKASGSRGIGGGADGDVVDVADEDTMMVAATPLLLPAAEWTEEITRGRLHTRQEASGRYSSSRTALS